MVNMCIALMSVSSIGFFVGVILCLVSIVAEIITKETIKYHLIIIFTSLVGMIAATGFSILVQKL